ncbi:MAG: formate dehydrogenase accessory sulfurtransferase FdhD [Spirochaetes bacterium]|nr:formate dehydrogenase accessory sulfurtransferase FdhD [Spirochaetota bacterium]
MEYSDAGYKNIEMIEILDGVKSVKFIPVSREHHFDIFLNGEYFSTMSCSGSNLKEMVLGHLVSEAVFIRDITNEIKISPESSRIDVTAEGIADRTEGSRMIHSAGGYGRKSMPDESCIRKSLPEISAEIIDPMMTEFLKISIEHELTGGVHSSAVYDLKGRRVAFFDDIGRHNAFDKSIGFLIENKIEILDKIILTTGRVSAEIALKSIRSGAPVLVSRASPTTMGVELLRSYNMTALCRARGRGFLVINGAERIKC